MFYSVPAEYIDDIWPRVVEQINLASEYSENLYSVTDAYKSCSSGKQQLWILTVDDRIVSTSTTTITKYLCGKKIFKVVACGGNEVVKNKNLMMDSFKKFASDNGCSSIEFSGRPGWKRLLREYNPQFVAVTYKINLQEGSIDE